MAWRRTLRFMAVCGMLLAVVAVHRNAVGQTAAVAQPSSSTYAIPLKDGNTAVVWWDAVSDPAHPGWRCEVPGQRGTGTGRTIIPLAAPAGDWQEALAEAKALLKNRFTERE